jgi:hypothetical protein
MTDAEFIAAFERGELAPAQFNHRAHVRVAHGYLRALPFLEACIAMRDGLQGFAARIGKPLLYHETKTIAFMSLVAQGMRDDAVTGWESLLAAHPVLADSQLLQQYYPAGLLDSDLARQQFVLAQPLPLTVA